MASKKLPDHQSILDMARAFMPACVVGAAAELDLFSVVGEQAVSADAVTERLGADRRAIGVLLDAVVALDLLEKRDDLYSIPPELRPLLIEGSSQNILPMIRHASNIQRGWSQLAWVAKAGIPGPRHASIRGPQADRDAFVAAMDTVSRPVADEVVARLGPLEFEHLLDVGGASGTWTLAFLRAVPRARATLFDLPDAIKQARARISGSPFADRVDLVAGDFYVDDLPGGSDFAWVSAIVHQHSRRHNRELFVRVHAALEPGGRIAIRDVVMQPCRTRPKFGAMFAVNMLANTETGTTFTFDELAEDLVAAGFIGPELAVQSDDISSVVMATRP